MNPTVVNIWIKAISVITMSVQDRLFLIAVFLRWYYTVHCLSECWEILPPFCITCSKHLHTPTFISICSLAITDLTVVVISLFVKMYDNDKFFEGNVLFVALLVLYIAMINSADVVFLFFLHFFWLCIRSSVDSTSQIHLSSVHCWSYGDTAFLLFLLFLLLWTALYHWFMKKPKVQI